jgi:hypothetical protein
MVQNRRSGAECKCSPSTLPEYAVEADFLCYLLFAEVRRLARACGQRSGMFPAVPPYTEVNSPLTAAVARSEPAPRSENMRCSADCDDAAAMAEGRP